MTRRLQLGDFESDLFKISIIQTENELYVDSVPKLSSLGSKQREIGEPVL